MKGLCETRRFGTGGPATLLIEVPHGATTHEHFQAVRDRMTSPLPEDLEQFYYVNTDVGAPECAEYAAERLAEAGRSVVVVRCLVPRTFVDCNRVLDGEAQGEVRDGVTPGLPAYMTTAADHDTLFAMHRQYHEHVAGLYREACEGSGMAIMLHTYAPRSIQIERVDAGIVEALRIAYLPDNYDTWQKRPDVEVITETVDGQHLAHGGLVEAMRRHYDDIDVSLAENVTYRLQTSTMGYVYASRHPGRTVCIELNRGRLADPFTPFREMQISERSVATMTAPLVTALTNTMVF